MIPKQKLESQIEMNKQHGHRIKENSCRASRGGETHDPGQKENVTYSRLRRGEREEPSNLVIGLDWIGWLPETGQLQCFFYRRGLPK
jgi:hypothetical protein